MATASVVETSFNVVADNLLSGNNNAGVKLDGDGFGPPPIGNIVERNVIGLDAGGSAALPNEDGVVVEDSHRNAITDNVISDNTGRRRADRGRRPAPTPTATG